MYHSFTDLVTHFHCMAQLNLTPLELFLFGFPWAKFGYRTWYFFWYDLGRDSK